jgi:hypothetical protein
MVHGSKNLVRSCLRHTRIPAPEVFTSSPRAVKYYAQEEAGQEEVSVLRDRAVMHAVCAALWSMCESRLSCLLRRQRIWCWPSGAAHRIVLAVNGRPAPAGGLRARRCLPSGGSAARNRAVCRERALLDCRVHWRARRAGSTPD